MVELRVQITFSLDSAYHVSADRVSLGLDKALYLDPKEDPRNRKIPSIPATSIKGVLRNQTEVMLRAKGVNDCEAPMPDRMCNSCIVCQVFGSPKVKSKLIFKDGVLKDSQIDFRMGVGIDRRKRTAKEDVLFSTEIGFGKDFSSEIEGLFISKEEALEACALLFIGAKGSFALGGSKSRGLGWLKFQSFKAFIDDKDIPQIEIEKALREVIRI